VLAQRIAWISSAEVSAIVVSLEQFKFSMSLSGTYCIYTSAFLFAWPAHVCDLFGLPSITLNAHRAVHARSGNFLLTLLKQSMLAILIVHWFFRFVPIFVELHHRFDHVLVTSISPNIPHDVGIFYLIFRNFF
jgi:hypothetical protein